jgi:hypothetical protein
MLLGGSALGVRIDDSIEEITFAAAASAFFVGAVSAIAGFVRVWASG